MDRILSKTIVFFIVALIAGTAMAQQIPLPEQRHYEIKYIDGQKEIVCYAGDESHYLRIPPPRLLKELAGRTSTSKFNVTYSGFDNNPNAQDAFQFAVEIWEKLLKSDVVINVNAEFSTNLDENTLGSAVTGGLILNPAGAQTPRFSMIYPIALAEKIAQEPLNDASTPDVFARFNASRDDWYFGTDGNPGASEFDFVTVVLHELGHGLGFNGGVSYENGEGTIGFQGFPFTFTSYVETSDGESLVYDITNGTTEMGDALTGNSLFFKSDLFQGINKVKLYAPTEFVQGQTLFHLDDNTYKDSEDALMTPFIDMNEVMHSPGKALDMLNDLGWVFTWLDHQPLSNTENYNSDFEVTTTVSSDEGFIEDSLYLYYRYVNVYDTTDSDSFKVQLTPTGNPNEYNAFIQQPAADVQAVYYYYISSYDSAESTGTGRRFTNPGQPEFFEYAFIAALDSFPPDIVHSPIKFILDDEDSIKISTKVTDVFMGVDTVYVDYMINSVQKTSFGLIRDTTSTDLFVGYITLSPGEVQQGDVISYHITAIDTAMAQNTTVSPSSGFYEINVEGQPEPVMVYSTNFDAASNDFFSNSFVIETPQGFTNGALHSPHPYDQANDLGETEFNYTARLKFPIILKEETEALMQFDEVALIEPGGDGSVYGDDNFWDYVIVEGSKDGGNTWVDFIDGYDSRDNSTWLNAWNSGLDPSTGNSDASGNSTMFNTRTFNLLTNSGFSAQDTVLIRFRLFSDPFAAGWGWAIDNLKIQDDITGLDDLIASEDGLKIYPNPVTHNYINIEANFVKPVNRLAINVVNILGQTVYNTVIPSGSTKLEHRVDLSGHPEGIYVLNLKMDRETVSRRIVKLE